jgi:hypothetical protein
MATIMDTLFGVSAERFQQERDAAADAQALQYARLSPIEKASFGVQRGAYGLAGALGGALGGTDPELQRRTQAQQILGMIDPNRLETFDMAAKMAEDRGDQQLAFGLRLEGNKYKQEAAINNSLIAQRGAAEKASLAQAAKTEFGIKQEEKLRDELSALGLNATQDQILSVVTKYGPPEKVLAALQVSADRAAQREATLTLGREKIAAKLESDLTQAKTDIEKEKLRIEAKRELAQLMASLKGPSSAVIKAQEKAEKVEEGQIALGDTISTAETLVKDLAKMGGITSTSKGPLANLVTSLQTGTVGQMGGRVFGTKEQAKRDELKSIRLQLLNAVKEATGMSAQQLNSNVELKTYLDSLGSEGMTKEANLAILDNLSRRYLKGEAAQPAKNKSDPLGIR